MCRNNSFWKPRLSKPHGLNQFPSEAIPAEIDTPLIYLRMSASTDICCMTHDLLFRLAFYGTPLGQLRCQRSSNRSRYRLHTLIMFRSRGTRKEIEHRLFFSTFYRGGREVDIGISEIREKWFQMRAKQVYRQGVVCAEDVFCSR